MSSRFLAGPLGFSVRVGRARVLDHPADEIAALRAQVTALREAMTEIAQQSTSGELNAEQQSWADYVHAYDACVVRARAALKDKP